MPILPHPKTSAGILTLMILLFSYLTYMKIKSKNNFLSLFKKKKIFHRPMDFFVIAYLLGNCLSIFFSNSMPSLVNLRFVFLGTIMYFVVQLSFLSDKQNRFIINGLAILTLLVSAISILQLIIPGIMNWIATAYLGSADAQGLSGDIILGVNHSYNGIVADLGRGRLLHWGSIILCFPAFYLALLLNKEKKKSRLFYLRVIIGFALIVISFVSANFRWTAICFLIVTLFTSKILNYFEFLRKRMIIMSLIVLLFLGLIGLYISSAAFGYNLIDRFLLSNAERDINDTMGRLYLYQLAINVFEGSPIFGVGLGNYYEFVQRIQNFRHFSIHDQMTYVITPMAPHNDWFLILAETGLVGISFFFLIIYSTFKQYWLIFKKYIFSKEELFLHILGFNSILLFFLYGMFENIYPHNFIYLFTFMGLAFSHDSKMKLGKNEKQ